MSSQEKGCRKTGKNASGRDKVAPRRQPAKPEPLESVSLEGGQFSEQVAVRKARAAPHLLSTRDVLQLQRVVGNRATGRVLASVQRQQASASQHQPVQQDSLDEENDTGLPDHLKTGVESLSGTSIDDVRVHYNSSKPATLQALAYTQGTDIHVAPGQENSLAHEAWHVVQQKQGRVQPTIQADGVEVNDDPALENEADVMGKSALQNARSSQDAVSALPTAAVRTKPIVQMAKERIDKKKVQFVTLEEMLGFLRTLDEQLDEYIGYPDTISKFDGSDIKSWKAKLRSIGEDLRKIMKGEKLKPTDEARKRLGKKRAKGFGDRIVEVIKALNERYDEWKTWKKENPETVNDLKDVVSGKVLGIKKGENYRYGMYESTLYRVVGNQLPEKARQKDREIYKKYQKRQTILHNLKSKVRKMDTKTAITIPQNSPLSSDTKGAKAMKKAILGKGYLIFTRVMSKKEADKIEEQDGKLIPKLGAAKWLTIGTKANISSSGNKSHAYVAQWTIKGIFRNILMLPDVQHYNESESSAKGYKEPYWVFKDDEEYNIGLSPVLVEIFNTKIENYTVSKLKLEK